MIGQFAENWAPSLPVRTHRRFKNNHAYWLSGPDSSTQPRIVQQTDYSHANIISFRTISSAHFGNVDNVFGEERVCETVSSIDPELVRSKTEAHNFQVKHFDSSLPKYVSADATNSASSFQRGIFHKL